jgi:hypothetical protein
MQGRGSMVGCLAGSPAQFRAALSGGNLALIACRAAVWPAAVNADLGKLGGSPHRQLAHAVNVLLPSPRNSKVTPSYHPGCQVAAAVG